MHQYSDSKDMLSKQCVRNEQKAIDVVHFSRMLVNFQTTLCHIPEGSTHSGLYVFQLTESPMEVKRECSCPLKYCHFFDQTQNL